MRIQLLVMSVLLLLALPCAAHPGHLSETVIRKAAKQGEYRLEFRFDSAALCGALARRYPGLPLSKAITRYLYSHFAIQINQTRPMYRVISAQSGPNYTNVVASLQIYNGPISQIRVSNKIFLEETPSQRNRFIVDFGGASRSFMTNINRKEIEIEI